MSWFGWPERDGAERSVTTRNRAKEPSKRKNAGNKVKMQGGRKRETSDWKKDGETHMDNNVFTKSPTGRGGSANGRGGNTVTEKKKNEYDKKVTLIAADWEGKKSTRQNTAQDRGAREREERGG